MPQRRGRCRARPRIVRHRRPVIPSAPGGRCLSVPIPHPRDSGTTRPKALRRKDLRCPSEAGQRLAECPAREASAAGARAVVPSRESAVGFVRPKWAVGFVRPKCRPRSRLLFPNPHGRVSRAQRSVSTCERACPPQTEAPRSRTVSARERAGGARVALRPGHDDTNSTYHRHSLLRCRGVFRARIFNLLVCRPMRGRTSKDAYPCRGFAYACK